MAEDMFDLLEDEEDIDEDEVDETEEVEDLDDTEEEIIPYEYGIDFETGQLTGEIVSGVDAIKVWAWLALNTARYRYLIYSWEYGSELESLIGTEFTEEFTAARAKKFIEECLFENEHITDISEYNAIFENDRLTCSFIMGTEYGEEEMTINV